jgi:hypothetical protein
MLDGPNDRTLQRFGDQANLAEHCHRENPAEEVDGGDRANICWLETREPIGSFVTLEHWL